MATHDYVLNNAPGADFRADCNDALAAIVSHNSSATEPATMYAYMPWADTANDIMKVRNAGNTDWVSVYTLSTGVPISGGGGGGAAANGLEILNFDASTMPTTWQIATTPAAVNGVSYAKGDIFFYAYHHSGTTEMYEGVGMANRAFTYDSSKGISWHILSGDMYTPDTGSSFSKVLAADSPVLTSVTLQIHGHFVSVRDITFDISLNEVAAATPYNYTGSTRRAIWPIVWAMSEQYSSGNLVPMYADDDQFLSPCYMKQPNFVDTTRDKLDVAWPNANGISLCYMDQPQSMQSSSAVGPFAVNGTVVTVGDISLFCNETILDGDILYLRNPYIGTTLLSPIGNLITRAIVDADTMRIGTWNSANGGTLTVNVG